MYKVRERVYLHYIEYSQRGRQIYPHRMNKCAPKLERHQPECPDKKEKKIFLIYKEILVGKGFLLYEEMRNYLTRYEIEEAVSHI